MESIVKEYLAGIPKDEMKKIEQKLADAMKKLVSRSTRIKVTGKEAGIISCIIDQKYPELEYEFKESHHARYYYQNSSYVYERGWYTHRYSSNNTDNFKDVMVNDYDGSYVGQSYVSYLEKDKSKCRELSEAEKIELVHPQTDICEFCADVIMTIRYPKVKPKAFY